MEFVKLNANFTVFIFVFGPSLTKTMIKLGIIGGSGLLQSAMFSPSSMKELVVHTKHGFGSVKGFQKALSERVELIFVQRHACDVENEYSPPHLVNYRAIIAAFEELQVAAIIAVCSVGSMKHHIGLGALVMPDDFFCPQRILSMHDDVRGHNMPGFDEPLRQEVLTALFQGGLRPLDGGVYVNSNGPRFETKAEIKFMSQFGDLIGMTGAHEATLAKEVDIPYAMLALVDNMANGVGEHLTIEKFFKVQEANQPLLESAVHVVLNHFKAYPDVLTRLRELAEGEGELADKAGRREALEDCDEVIHAQCVVTVDADNKVLQNHAIVLKDGKILEILPSAEADRRFGSFSRESLTITRLPDQALMPGLINAHTHSPMVYMRGFSDDLRLDLWLTQKIWPAEVRAVSYDFVREGSRHAIAEMLLGGTTCFSDMYFFPEATAEIINETGMRGFVGCIIIEFPSNYGANAEEYLVKGRAMLERFRDKSSRLNFTVSPHSTYGVSEEHIVAAHRLAKEFGLPFHTHLHETQREVDDSEKGDRSSQFCHQCDKACRPIKNLFDLEIVDEKFVAAHMVYFNDEEIKLLAEKGGSVVHCPTSNMKLGSGFCNTQKLQAAGVNVAIGTDGASSNNSLDMFAEMKLAAILAKGITGDPEAVPAEAAVRMATINGAKALGIEDKVGSLEVGKQADIVAVDLSYVSCMPTYHVTSHLVYACGRNQVSDVWIDGRRLVRNRQLLTIDEGKLRRFAEKWQAAISEVDQSHDGSYK